MDAVEYDSANDFLRLLLRSMYAELFALVGYIRFVAWILCKIIACSISLASSVIF